MSLTRQEEILRLRLKLAQEKEYLDVKDVMMYTGYSYSTIHRRIKEGFLKPYQHVKGGRLLFSKESIKCWIEGGLL